MRNPLPHAGSGDTGDPLAFDLRDRLRKSLQASGHNTHTLAGAMGVHPNTISNYLAGRTRPSRPVLTAWAVAIGGYGVTAEWLETGVTPDPTKPGQAVGPANELERQAAKKAAELARRQGRDFDISDGAPDTHRYAETG